MVHYPGRTKATEVVPLPAPMGPLQPQDQDLLLQTDIYGSCLAESIIRGGIAVVDHTRVSLHYRLMRTLV